MNPATKILKILGPVLLVLVLAATAEPAFAQGAAQVEEYIQKTEDLILWARDLVAETESGPARQVLRGAADLNQGSRASLEGKRYRQALEQSRRARTAAYHSVRLAREAMGLEERIRIRADRFADVHRQLTERAQELEHRQASDLLDRALRKADRAREQYHQGDFQLAWKMFEQAEDLNRRAARMLADIGGPDRLDRELEITAERIDQVGESLGADADPRALELLDQARQTLEKAHEARNQGQPGRALQLAGLARQQANRAGRMVGNGPDADAVRIQIERFDERFARIADQVRESGNDRARDTLEQARRHRDGAEDYLAEGDTDQALRRIRAGHDLLGQAEDLMRP